jgi:hypothetical protein
MSSSPAPRSIGLSSPPATSLWSTCARSQPRRFSPGMNPRSPVALKILLDHCGRSTDRWRALAAAMSTTKRRSPSESSSSPWTALPPERRHPD